MSTVFRTLFDASTVKEGLIRPLSLSHDAGSRQSYLSLQWFSEDKGILRLEHYWCFMLKTEVFVWTKCSRLMKMDYSVPDPNICILLVLDGKHSEVSKTVWMMSVSITELMWQTKTWEKSNQDVGHLSCVVFQSLAYRIHIEIWMKLHFLGLPLDVNHL